MASAEQDLRLELLNTLLTTPHRRLDLIWPVHCNLVDQDPLFYVRLAAWYADHGDVRDHKEMFIVTLVQSGFDGHRDVGLALLRRLPPYEVVRVVDFIHGRTRVRKVSTRPKAARRDKAQRVFRREPAPSAPSGPAFESVVEKIGLFRNVPRSVKTEVTRYLKEREADPEWFDSTVLVARKALKRLYAVLHIPPGARAQQILFDRNPPSDSRVFALKQLVRADTPAAQARAIVEHRIPYRVAATVVRQMTPTVLLALIERMSPQELINNLGALRKHGAFNNPELKAVIEDKLGEAKTAARISAFKAGEAAKAAGVSPEIEQKLGEVADAQIKAKGRIRRPTALLIDKSASMEQAIEIGKQIGAMISAIADDRLYVYAFDTVAYAITPEGTDLADWERAFRGIRAGGCTSCGISLTHLRKKQQYVEQIILVTDEGENTTPMFLYELNLYREAMKADPGICLVRTPGGGPHLESQCRAAGIPADVFQFTGDYYALPNLIPLLTRPSKMELLMEIMDCPLPQRKPA